MTDHNITCEHDECSSSLQCDTCMEFKALEAFYRSTTGHPWNKCKECVFEGRHEYYSTLQGFLKNLLHAARGSAKSRLEQGRLSAGQCDIVYDDLHELWVSQHGLCYYSGLPMITRSFSNWQCSLERINENLGYIKTNIVLCCAELNNAYQWSAVKVQRMLDILDADKCRPAVDFSPARKTHDVRRKPDVTVEDGLEYIQCTRCDTRKIRKDFPKVYSPGCKECIRKYHEKLRQTPAGHLKQLLSGTIKRTKKKQQNAAFADYDLTYDALVADISSIFAKSSSL